MSYEVDITLMGAPPPDLGEEMARPREEDDPGLPMVWVAPFVALVVVAFFYLQYANLAYPLLWQDEGETAMLGQRVVEHGYPNVRGDDGNVVYGSALPLRLGTDPDTGAYLGSLWGQYYYAALGVLWADGLEDPYARTWRLRFPFALAGTVGVVLFFVGAVPLFGRARSNRLLAFGVYMAGVTLSISLLVHLREVRYYALAVLLTGCLVALELRRQRILEVGLLHGCAVALALGVLFNVFYPAAVAVGIWLAIETLLSHAFEKHGRWPGLLRGLVPVAAVGILCVPIALYFELERTQQFFLERWSTGAGDYVANLRALGAYVLRYELVLLLVGLRFGVTALSFEELGRPVPARVEALNRASSALLRLGGIYILVGARNPVFFERYFMPLSPLITLIAVIDAHALMAWLYDRARYESNRRLFVAAAAGMGMLVAMCLYLRLPELEGRLREASEPYRGPVDFAVEYLQARFDDPSRIAIATNYEAEPLMYYLGSRVVGRFYSDNDDETTAEAETPVDVVIPRRSQPERRRPLRDFYRGRFESTPLPVVDVAYNNIPELFGGRVLRQTHLWRTPGSPRPGEGLVLYERVPEESVMDIGSAADSGLR